MAPILAPTVKLNNGYEMPVLGLGTYELWNIFHEPTRVRYALEKQLKALDTNYVDLYLMHSPVGYKYVDDEALMPHENDELQTNDIDYVETYKAMEELVSSGLVRSLGLSNFNSAQIQRILDSCTIKPVTNQSTNNEAEIAVKHAIDVGYRHIDTAYFYQNEAEVGKAIRDKVAEGVVKREDIFLVTKLWNIHHEPHLVEGACRKQLQLLGLDYIDLYLMHLPVGYKYVDDQTLMPKNEAGVLQLTDVDYLDTYKAMEKLVKLGLVRSIGVSNFNSEQILRVLENCEIKPVTNQVECSPGLNQKQLIKFCKEHNMTLTAYSPLGRPKPAEKKPSYYYSEKTKAIADKYKKTPAQIILRYLIEIGAIPIPKSSNPQRIEENFNVFDFKLTPEDIEVMDQFNTGERLVPFNLIKAQNHKYFPFSAEF